MSNQLHQAMTQILAMPYHMNQNARSGGARYGHEHELAERIKAAGFVEYPKSAYPKVTKSLLKKWAETGNDTDLRAATAGLPTGTYILQPAGTQGFPDILIKDFNDRFVVVEGKTGKGVCPMWNDNLPKPNAIYVFTSAAVDETTIFLGKDVITDAEQKLMDLQEAEVAKVVKLYNAKMAAIDVHKRGFLQKSRKQHFQGGGNAKTNYFTHQSRTQCEQNAMEYAKQ